jgi:hypothetical protein
MQLSDQTLVEFAVLTLTGIVWSVVTAMLVRDYRGALTSYTHRCWLTYQRPWYQRTFLRTASSRARHADETGSGAPSGSLPSSDSRWECSSSRSSSAPW